MAITRFVLRWGLIGGLAFAGSMMLIGEDGRAHVAAGLAQLRGHAYSLLAQCSDDPEILRQQLAALSEQYPQRIAEVKGEIAEVDRHIAQFDHDINVAQGVITLTTNDLQQLKTLIARAEERSTVSVRPVAIRYEGVRFDVNEAYGEARRINHVRQTYRDRLAHDEQQMVFLTEQNTRLDEILVKLESEFDTYQAQLWQLDRQIDAIQRNERLIELTEEQQATLDSYERFGKIGNLKQLEAKLAELRTIQEAQLEALSKRNFHNDYHAQAELELEGDPTLDDPFSELFEIIEPNTDNIILEEELILEEDQTQNPANSVAWTG